MVNDRINEEIKRKRWIYAWRKETIERSFAEARVNHDLRDARMLGIKHQEAASASFRMCCNPFARAAGKIRWDLCIHADGASFEMAAESTVRLAQNVQRKL